MRRRTACKRRTAWGGQRTAKRQKCARTARTPGVGAADAGSQAHAGFRLCLACSGQLLRETSKRGRRCVTLNINFAAKSVLFAVAFHARKCFGAATPSELYDCIKHRGHITMILNLLIEKVAYSRHDPPNSMKILVLSFAWLRILSIEKPLDTLTLAGIGLARPSPPR